MDAAKAVEVIKQVTGLWNAGKITNGSAMAQVAAVAEYLK